MHFPCNVSLPVKVPKFRVATALQHANCLQRPGVEWGCRLTRSSLTLRISSANYVIPPRPQRIFANAHPPRRNAEYYTIPAAQKQRRKSDDLRRLPTSHSAVVPHLVLDVGELRVVLVVLLVLRAVDCRVERSFHDRSPCGDSIFCRTCLLMQNHQIISRSHRTECC